LDVAAEVSAVAHKYLKRVRPSGPHNVTAICPFHLKASGHGEEHPSFAMNTINGLYICYACGERGNLYTFLKNIGLSRSTIALSYQLLLDAAAGNIPQASDPIHPDLTSTDPLPEALLGMFDFCPSGLLAAGFTGQTLRRFDIGYDRDHQRVVFPLRDMRGQLVGISGRATEGQYPRYKIYDQEYKKWDLPVRPGLNKRAILWNVHTIYPSVYFETKPSDVVVVEGFKACMWVWQAGIKNVVALLGTWLSWEQRWLLERMGGRVYLFLDNNEAGQIGTGRAGATLSRSLPVSIVPYPPRLAHEESAQPDNCSTEELTTAIQNATDYFAWAVH